MKLTEKIAQLEAALRGDEDVGTERGQFLKVVQHNAQMEQKLKDLEPQLAQLNDEMAQRLKTEGKYEAQAAEMEHLQAHGIEGGGVQRRN